MNEVVISIIGLLGTVAVAVLGLWGARKYNIGPNQDKLVDTLKDLVEAQGDRITQLEGLVSSNDKRIGELTAEVDRLTRLTVAQLVKIQELELQLEAERRSTHA